MPRRPSQIRLLLLGGTLGALVAGSALAQDQGPPPDGVLKPAPAVTSVDPLPAPASPPPDQPAPASPAPSSSAIEVSAAPLASPDLFFPGAPGRTFDETLWAGTPPALLASILPGLGPIQGEAGLNGLAVQILSTGAKAPEGAGQDAALAGLRALTLVRFGALPAAEAILARTPAVQAHERLSRAKAEAALYDGDVDGACATADSLAEGRDQPYWLKLRAFCLARAGKGQEAQLALDLAAHGADLGPLGLLLNAMALGAPPEGPGLADTALGLRVSLMLKLDLSRALAQASLPALQTLAAEQSLAPDLRRRAAFALIAYGPDATGAAFAAFSAPLPPAPPPPPPPPPVHKGKHAKAAPPPAPVLDPADVFARALAQFAQAPEAERAAALAELARAAGPERLAAAADLAGQALDGVSLSGLSPEASRPAALLLALHAGDPAAAPKSAPGPLYRLALRGVEQKSANAPAAGAELVSSPPARQTGLWLMALSDLKTGGRGGAGLIAAAAASQGGKALEPGDRALAIRLLSLSGFETQARKVALDGLALSGQPVAERR